ncbi:MAG: hypothetical protein ACKV2T_41420 [Kofleriaceae bacterium]
MLRGLWVMLAVGCTEVANPAYCDENADCNNGTVCNLDTHGCVTALVDAGTPDEVVEPDAPFVARTIQEVRAVSTPVDTPVVLSDVIITAIDRAGGMGDVWVQDVGGGPNSGIHVFSVLATDLDVLDVGHVIDISNARKATYGNCGSNSTRIEIEILPAVGGALVITKKGTGVVQTTTLDVAAIESLSPSQQDEELETWAGMLVRMTNIRADGPTEMAGNVQQFPIGPIRVNNTQSPLPSGIVVGTCFDEIVGVIECFTTYNVVPRQSSDIALGASCP